MIPLQLGRALLFVILGAMLAPEPTATAQTPHAPPAEPGWADRLFGLNRDHSGGWLFVGSKQGAAEGIYFALSRDGEHWKLINDGRPMIRQTQSAELMRDPFVQRAPDGSFRMVWTWSTGAPAVIGYSTSSNLISWAEHRPLPITAAMPDAINASAPALYYQADKKEWLLVWSSAALSDGAADDAKGNHIYATATKEFKHFAPARPFVDPQHDGNTFSADLVSSSNATSKFSLPAGVGHGSLLHLDASEYNLLLGYRQPLGSGSSK